MPRCPIILHHPPPSSTELSARLRTSYPPLYTTAAAGELTAEQTLAALLLIVIADSTAAHMPSALALPRQAPAFTLSTKSCRSTKGDVYHYRNEPPPRPDELDIGRLDRHANVYYLVTRGIEVGIWTDWCVHFQSHRTPIH